MWPFKVNKKKEIKPSYIKEDIKSSYVEEEIEVNVGKTTILIKSENGYQERIDLYGYTLYSYTLEISTESPIIINSLNVLENQIHYFKSNPRYAFKISEGHVVYDNIKSMEVEKTIEYLVKTKIVKKYEKV